MFFSEKEIKNNIHSNYKACIELFSQNCIAFLMQANLLFSLPQKEFFLYFCFNDPGA